MLVLDPQGKELAYIATGPSQADAAQPTGLPSNCEFGNGADARTLYITVDKSLYRIGLNIPAYHIPWAK